MHGLPVFWKLLLPFLLVVLVTGVLGAYVTVRDADARERSALVERLTGHVDDARAAVHADEIELVEAAHAAAGLDGIRAALASGDGAAAAGPLESVLRRHAGLAVVAAIRSDGSSLAELVRHAPGGEPFAAVGSPWVTSDPFTFTSPAAATEGRAGFARLGERELLVAVAPVCDGDLPCVPSGFAAVALDAGEVAGRAAVRNATDMEREVALFTRAGELLASTGDPPPPPAELEVAATSIEPRRAGEGDHRLVTAYAGFDLGGRPAGVVAVSVPAAGAFGSSLDEALPLAALLGLAMAIAVGAAALVSRRLLRQLRALVHTSRRLGAGELSARAPVLSDDEHGELARALNRMAERLEADRDTLELQVEQRTSEVRRLLRDRTEFFAGVSHELRTPLAVIITQASMLRSHSEDPSAAEEAGVAIGASASQLLDLVNDILSLARAEAGGVEVSATRLDLGALLADLTPMLARLGAASELEVHTRVEPGLPAVRADAARLREVVVNLASNAVKYTPAGGAVTIAAARAGDVVAVTVADTGVGIPVEVGDSVFEPFYLVPGTRAQREQASSGLGLALARRWVEAMGGTITWYPNPDGLGTVFAFTVPTAGLPPRAPRPRVERPPASSGAAATSS